MTTPTRIAVLGAGGRMGALIADLVRAGDDVTLAGTWRRSDGPPATVLSQADVAIDFTHCSATPEIAEACATAGVALVSGTTGLDAEAERALGDLAASVAVLHDGNMSLGIHLLSQLAARAAAVLASYDVEISETHHRMKRDAPSGTALKLGAAVAAVRGVDAGPRERFARDAARTPQEIGYAVRRGGQVIGEHSVALLGDFDRLEIHHAASDRRLFAEGALKAARWLVSRPPGRYAMADLFDAV